MKNTLFPSFYKPRGTRSFNIPLPARNTGNHDVGFLLFNPWEIVEGGPTIQVY